MKMAVHGLVDCEAQSTIEFLIVFGLLIIIAFAMLILFRFVSSGLIEQHALVSNIHLLSFDHIGFWGYVLLC